MKKFLLILLALVCILSFAGCSSDKDADSSDDAAAATAQPEVYPDEAIVAKLMEAIGPETIAKAKDNEYTLSVSFRSFKHTPVDGSDAEQPNVLQINVSIESPIGSTHPDSGIVVDIELMRAIHDAIFDSGIYAMTDEDKAAFKANYYKSEDAQLELYGDNAVYMNITETPTRYTVDIEYSGFDTTIPGLRRRYDLEYTGYTENEWYSFWKWDEFSSREVYEDEADE